MIEEQSDQTATLRRLPDGETHLATSFRIEGNILKVETALTSLFPSGTLVEVDCGQMLYLGEVYGSTESSLVIGIEHAVEQEGVANIQKNWKPSESAPS